ncbi:butyrophilin-like protein 10 [Scyliorhinus canicula]|uniref:butyrophilin-like protein 10 n=1 Tax=Scyliorhinus canicula TaxID=7830 RepID=UPI0018F28313|nr:butyrophilin-like protein 10 [Scyliorhinus canicula]
MVKLQGDFFLLSSYNPALLSISEQQFGNNCKFSLDIKNCHGQSFDNAANMSGKYSGLQARLNNNYISKFFFQMKCFNQFFPMMKRRCFSLVFLLVFHSVQSERFRVLVPDDPIVVTVGDDIVLECQLVPDISLDNLEIRWFTSDSASPVHLYSNGQDRPDVQDKAYRGRTELFKDEFPRGNASLKLKKIKASDGGSYTCFIGSKTYHDEAVIHLEVGGFGHRPWMQLEENNKDGLRIVCKSDGWYPDPVIRWEDGNGQDVTAQSEWEFLKDSRGLITVQSHIDVTSDSVNRFSCFMENRLLRKRREAHVQISDEFFPKINVWLVIFWVVASLVVLAVAADVLVHRKEDQRIQGRSTNNNSTLLCKIGQ